MNALKKIEKTQTRCSLLLFFCFVSTFAVVFSVDIFRVPRTVYRFENGIRLVDVEDYVERPEEKILLSLFSTIKF